MRWLYTILRWLLATGVTVIAASGIHSWTIQRGLTALGVAIPADLAMQTAFNDFIGLAPALAAVFGIALAIGFLIAEVLRHRLKIPALSAFPLAGGVAIAVTLGIMAWQMGMTPVASAREPLGFLLLSLSGALGGLVFVASRRR